MVIVFAQYLSFLPWKADRTFVIALKAGRSIPTPGPGACRYADKDGKREAGRADNEQLRVIVKETSTLVGK